MLTQSFKKFHDVVRIVPRVGAWKVTVLAAELSTRVFGIIAIAPLCGLVALLTFRWEPSGYDVDAEDFEAAGQRVTA